MKTTPLLAFVMALAVATGCAPKVNDPADIKAVTQTVEAFAAAMNAGDAEGLVAMMTDKTIYADNHFPVAVGKAAVQRMYTAQFGMFTTQFKAPVEDVRVAGDLAVARGTWTIKLTPKAEGLAPITDSGSWMALSSRQADGSWKWDWLVPNSNQPMAGATADGSEEQAIVQIERGLTSAIVKRDIPALETYLGTEWTPTNDGQVTPGAQLLAEIKSGVYKVESDTIRDLSVHVFGDVAVATMMLDAKATYKGADVSGSFRSIDFLVKRDGRWQIVNSQNTTIKQ